MTAKRAKPRRPAAAPPRPAAGIQFEAVVIPTEVAPIARLPVAASKQLPSRGQVAVHGTLDGHDFETVIEPDGELGHWIKLEGIAPGRRVTIEVEPVETWPEPVVPSDLSAALARAPAKVRTLWDEITPMARWEWVRWVNETKNPATRHKRVTVTISKLGSGKRRPCCFNLASCTDPALAKSGKLALPE